jgi:hypothetical protein
VTFDVGESVLHRNVELGRPRFVVPSTVVIDGPSETQLLRRCGTAIKAPRSFALHTDGIAYEEAARSELLEDQWEFIDATWEHTDVLVVATPRDWYSTWLMWHATTAAFLGYYINFERPWLRTDLGFDTTDLAIDLVVDTQHRRRWKDEDAFARRVDLGLITEHEEVAVHAAMRDVVDRIEARDGVFSGALDDWRPNAAWNAAELPHGWDAPR